LIKFFFFFIVVGAAVCCSHHSGSSNNLLSQADSLLINFNRPGTNEIQGTIETTVPDGIQKMAGFIKDKAVPEYKCGYDGNILFYKKDSLLADVSFNYTGKDCRHFIQLVDGKLKSTEMSNEATDFLKSLAEGKPWY
jgi:hypothetical protein